MVSYGPPDWTLRCACGCITLDHGIMGCQSCGECSAFVLTDPDDANLCGLCGVQTVTPPHTACRQCAG